MSVREEQLLIVRDWGLQKRTRLWCGLTRHVFIDAARIQSVLINEAFRLHRAVTYVAFCVRDAPRLVLGFEHLLPRLPAVLETYHGARAVLLGERD
jgi:hypothetical protein